MKPNSTKMNYRLVVMLDCVIDFLYVLSVLDYVADLLFVFDLLNILVPILIRYSTYLSFFGVQLTKQDLQVRRNSPRGPVSYLLVGKCHWHLVQYIADSIVLLYRADVCSVCGVRLGDR